VSLKPLKSYLIFFAILYEPQLFFEILTMRLSRENARLFYRCRFFQNCVSLVQVSNKGENHISTHFHDYSASSIIRPCWATFFQNLGRIRKVSIVGFLPSTTYTTLKRT